MVGPQQVGVPRARYVVKMSRYSASYFGAEVDTDRGEGWITFQRPHDLYGYEQLTIDLDGHCSRRMPIRSGNGPPDFLRTAT